MDLYISKEILTWTQYVMHAVARTVQLFYISIFYSVSSAAKIYTSYTFIVHRTCVSHKVDLLFHAFTQRTIFSIPLDVYVFLIVLFLPVVKYRW